MKKEQYYIIDFDSTFVKTETLEELANVVLKSHTDKKTIYEKIKRITDLGMEGKLNFRQSLEKRLKLIKITRDDIKKVIRIFKSKITLSVRRNRKFFRQYGDRIYIVSGGFKEIISPVVAAFGIPANHILANTFLFDRSGNVIGYDRKNPLLKKEGKYLVVKSLKLDGDIFIIGDGYTDYQIKALGGAKSFIAFTENVNRVQITSKADQVAPSFDEFLFANRLPTSLSYPKNRIKVLLLENISSKALDRFKNEGYSVEHEKGSMSEKELMKKIKDVSILGIRSKTKVTGEVLKNANRLIGIGAFCIGTDQIDLNEAASRGIAVFNAPYSNTRSVVELVIGEIIMLMRNVFTKSVKLHNGVWDKSAKNSNEVRGKTLGIVGYGNIGSQLSVVAESLGMNVLFYDKVDKLVLGNAKKCMTMKELLKASDVVTIHVDGVPSNKNLIGRNEFDLMRDGVIFINASRGFVVDLKAMRENIVAGKIRGAAVDVFPNEPKSNEEKFVSELQGLPNVILTPHVAGSTIEAQENIGQYVAEKMISYVNTGNTYMSVSLPNIQVSPVRGAYRLLHIHRNVPGILAKINEILAGNKMNILGQDLKTNAEVGYVVTDVNKKYDKKVFKELKQIPDTIRFRMLY